MTPNYIRFDLQADGTYSQTRVRINAADAEAANRKGRDVYYEPVWLQVYNVTEEV